MSGTAIEGLCDAFEAILLADPRGPGVATLLASYVAENDDWRAYRLFDERMYARNLVRASDLFELIVICWQADHGSPIHNHASQHCWMAVLEGVIEEIWFAEPAPSHVGPLTRTSSMRYGPGEVSYIHDDLALHAIRPTGDGPAVTLHLYARPIQACNVYCPDTGRIEERTLAYYSVGGRRVSPDPVRDTPPPPGASDA